MHIEWNKITWYSKITAIGLFVLVFYVGYYLGQKKKTVNPDDGTTPKQVVNTPPSISITSKTIKEDNWSGKVAVVSGTNTLAAKSREYVDKTVADFRKQANTDVPAMRLEFGTETPPQYELNIDAKYIKGTKAESVVMSVYTYTGGAHGNSSYKVISASLTSGKILSLSSIIKTDKQVAFTDLVKKELNNWKPDGNSVSPVFPEEVKALKFASFTNWSLDDKYVTLYFSQYEIGPGVLGPIAFPLSLDKVKNFLN